jgi:hypothetical protein
VKFKVYPYRHPMNGLPQPGKIHSIRADDNQKTLCGVNISKIPGLLIDDDTGSTDCLGCLRIASRPRRWTSTAPAVPAVGTTFYLCGKIEKDDWRHQLVNYELRDEPYPLFAYRRGAPIIQDGLGKGLHYGGPFFIGCDHGCYHGPNSHGVSANSEHFCIEEFDEGPQISPPFKEFSTEVTKNCLTSIAHASIIFAWIDDLSAYGSLAELGYARALKKPIWLAWPKPLPDLWFIWEMASVTIIAQTASSAFHELLATQLNIRLQKPTPASF